MQDIFVMQPIKVLFIAMFVALIVKKLEDEEKSNVEKQARNLAQDEEWLHPSSSDSEQENKKVKKPRFNPSACAPSKEELARARDERLKEMQMKSITRELMFYTFFCFVVYVLGMSTRDTMGFHQTINTRETLQLDPRPVPKFLSYRTKDQFPKVTFVHLLLLSILLYKGTFHYRSELCGLNISTFLSRISFPRSR